MKKEVPVISGKDMSDSELLKEAGWLTYEELRILVRRETHVSPRTLATWFRWPLSCFASNLVEHKHICQPDNWKTHRLYHADLVPFFTVYIANRSKLFGKGTSLVRRTDQFTEFFKDKSNFQGDHVAKVIQLRLRKAS